jgi:hypothetical protein
MPHHSQRSSLLHSKWVGRRDLPIGVRAGAVHTQTLVMTRHSRRPRPSTALQHPLVISKSPKFLSTLHFKQQNLSDLTFPQRHQTTRRHIPEDRLLVLTALTLCRLMSYIYIYMSYRTANLQTLNFKYLFKKYPY